MPIARPCHPYKRESMFHAFQWELRSCLEFFLNNGWYRRRRDWSPLVGLFEIIAGHPPCRGRSEIDVDAGLQAKLIAECYALCASGSVPEGILETRTVACAAFDSSNYQEAYLRKSLLRIECLLETVVDKCSYVGIHGSMSTMDYTPYSDIDLLAIITRDAAKDPVALLALRKAMRQVCSVLYEYDPLQHHGVFFCTEYELTHYPEAFLPIASLQRARQFGGSCVLNIAPRDSLFEASRSFLSLSTTTMDLS